MKRKYNISAWFLSFVFTVCAVVLIRSFRSTEPSSSNPLIILIALPAVAVILWIFFRTGLAARAEKWIKSSYDDFLNEVKKSK